MVCSKVFQCIYIYIYIVFHILYPCKLLNIGSSFLFYIVGPKNRVPISSVQSLSCVWLFATPWLQHARLPCPSPTPRVCSNLCPSSQWCHPTISSSLALLLRSVFLSIRVFSNDLVICIMWPNYWSFSFSISPSDEYYLSRFKEYSFQWILEESPYDLTVPLLDIYWEKILIWKETCTITFIAMLFTIAKTWEQPKCLSTYGYIKCDTHIQCNITQP